MKKYVAIVVDIILAGSISHAPKAAEGKALRMTTCSCNTSSCNTCLDKK